MTKMIVAGVLGVVWRLFGACLEGVLRVSGSLSSLEGVWGFEEGVCVVSGRCL